MASIHTANIAQPTQLFKTCVAQLIQLETMAENLSKIEEEAFMSLKQRITKKIHPLMPKQVQQLKQTPALVLGGLCCCYTA